MHTTLRKSAWWRGSPTATKKGEFCALLRKINTSKKKEIFYDLGCGYGNVCIWIAPRVKLAVGFENHRDRFKRAKLNVKRSKLKNIEIRNVDFDHTTFKRATLIYSMVDVGLHTMASINRQAEEGTRIIQYNKPNYPIRGKRISGNYFLMQTPLKKVKDENEFAKIVLGRKRASINDLHHELGLQARRELKKEIAQADKAWKALFVKK